MMNNSPDTEEDGAHILLDCLGDGLDPQTLTALIPMKPHRARRKGQPLAKSGTRKSPLAETGYCGFGTNDIIPSSSANSHAEALLAILEPRIDAIRALMAADDITWSAVLFEGDGPGQSFADLDEDLLRRIARLDLPFEPKGYEAVTFVYVGNMSFQDDHTDIYLPRNDDLQE